MSKLLVILKYILIDSLGLNKFLGKGTAKENFKTIAMGLLILLSICVIIFDLGLYYHMMGNMLNSIGLLKVIIYVGVIFSSLVVIVTSMYKAQGILFFSKDFDTLLSMPVKTSTVLFVKVFQLYLMNIGLVIIGMTPAIIVYGMYSYLTVFQYIIAFALMLFIALIPTTISIVIAFLLSTITSRLKRSNIANLIGMSLVFVVSILISNNSQYFLEKITKNATDIESVVKKIYMPAYFYAQSIVNYSIIDTILYIAISVIPFVIIILVLSNSFRTLISGFSSSYVSKGYKGTMIKDIKVNKQYVAVLKKEIKRYFGSAIYVLNTIFGVILLFGLSVTTIFKGTELINKMFETNLDQNSIAQFLTLAVAVIAAMSCTTSVSISLEGNNLWIMKSLPIRAKEIFKGKILLNLLIVLPLTYISIVIMSYSFKIGIYDSLYAMLTCTVVSVLVSMMGMVSNLMLPNLKWKSETVAVKQSISVILTMLMGLLIIGGPATLYIKKLQFIQYNNFLNIMIFIYLILICVTWYYLKTKGEKIFSKL